MTLAQKVAVYRECLEAVEASDSLDEAIWRLRMVAEVGAMQLKQQAASDKKSARAGKVLETQGMRA